MVRRPVCCKRGYEGNESVMMNGMEWNDDEKGFKVDVVVKDVWRKGGELIGIEVHE